MPVFTADGYDDHQLVIHCRDHATGLRGIIAIHDTTLGPALGGCRMWPYADAGEALTDVLRLSQGMTLKAAVAGLPFGGGKSVIIGDARRDKTPALVAAFARCVEALGGRYIMAEDVGTTVADMDVALRETAHVVGVTGGVGDPSPATARGVLSGMRAAVEHRLGRDSLRGVRVAVQGLGNVGMNLARLLAAEGARLVVSDLDPRRLERAAAEFGAEGLAPEDIIGADVEVFAPCALGGVIDDRAVERLRAAIVAGSANNQLARPRHGAALRSRGVLYAPDYVINAGGLILVASEATGGSAGDAMARVDAIGATLGEILRRSDRDDLPTSAVADALARERLRAAGGGTAAAA